MYINHVATCLLPDSVLLARSRQGCTSSMARVSWNGLTSNDGRSSARQASPTKTPARIARSGPTRVP